MRDLRIVIGLHVLIVGTAAAEGGDVRATHSPTQVGSRSPSLQLVPPERGDDLNALKRIEAYLMPDEPLEGVGRRGVDALIAKLGDLQYEVRRKATRTLARIPDIRPYLAKQLEKAEDPEIRVRLQRILSGEGRAVVRREALARHLAMLYAKHADKLLEPRVKALMEDPDDPAARQFALFTPWESVAPRLAELPKAHRLRFLLMRYLYADTSADDEREMLKRYAADRVIAELDRLGYTVVIEKPQRDGAYLWTTRAKKVEGNTATGVVRISINDRRGEAEEASWVHIQHWDRWVYLFRFDRQHNNNDGVAWMRHGPSAKQPFIEPGGEGRHDCETVRGFPPSAKVPTYAVTAKEAMEWHLGAAYEWAKDAMPAEIAAKVNFRENEFEPPALVAPAPE